MLTLADYQATPILVLTAIAIVIGLTILIGMYLANLDQVNLLQSIDRSLKQLPAVQASIRRNTATIQNRKAG